LASQKKDAHENTNNILKDGYKQVIPDLLSNELITAPLDTKLIIDLNIANADGIIVMSAVPIILDTAGRPIIARKLVTELGLTEFIDKQCGFRGFGDALVISKQAVKIYFAIYDELFPIVLSIVEKVSSQSDVLLSLSEMELMKWSKFPGQNAICLGSSQIAHCYSPLVEHLNTYVPLPIITTEGTIEDINEGDELLNFDDEEFIIPLDIESEFSVPVRLTKKLLMKANTQIYVPIYFNKDSFNGHDKYGMIIPSSIISETCVRIAAGRVTVDTDFILVSNWSETDVFLHTGALIGHIIFNEFEIYNLDEEDEDDDIYMPAIDPDTVQNLKEEELVNEDDFRKMVYSKLKSNLTIMEKDQVFNLLCEWRRIFSKNDKSPGIITSAECTVPLIDEEMIPIRRRYYRFAPKVVEKMKFMIEEMEMNGIIRKSSSPWAFPVVLAIKSDGSYRFCIDYSKLTSCVKRDAFALPRIDDYLDRLKDAKYFTVVDCSSGFWQIKVKEEMKERLAFITPFGNYEPNVMPFGFTNAPAIFQRAISETLNPYLFLCVLVYIDDVCIYSDDFEQHLEDIEKVFKQLDKYHWRLKLEKSQFAQNEINYLGFKVGDGTISPLESNIEKLKRMKKPLTVEDMSSLLGFTGFYKRFIIGYDYMIKPLRDLTVKGTKWLWTAEVESSYQLLIESLTKEPILKLPDYTRRFIVKTDCSQFAWGAVLAQNYNGVEHPNCFASGSLSNAGRSWPTWKREGFAVFKACNKWTHLLLGTEFDIYTDHQALLSILDPDKEQPPILVNWKLQLSKFIYKIYHRPGKLLVLEDNLSRSVDLLIVSVDSILKYQQEEPRIRLIIDFLLQKTEIMNEELKVGLRLLNLSIDRFVIENNMLYYIEVGGKKAKRRHLRLVLPEKSVNSVLNHYHTSSVGGHCGLEKFWFNVSEEYWCPDLYNIVAEYFKNCQICAMNRVIKERNSLPLPVIATKPLEIIEVDHMEVGVTSNEYLYILSVVDVFSKRVWWIPAKTQTAQETIQLLLDHVFYPNDFCQYFITDHGGAFENELMERLCIAADIAHEFNLPNRKIKGATGLVENKNKLVWGILRKVVDQFNQIDWSHYVSAAASVYNKLPSRVLDNYSPYEVFSGSKPRGVIDYEKVSLEVPSVSNYVVEHNQRVNQIMKEIKSCLDQNALKDREVRQKQMNNRIVKEWKVGMRVIITKLDKWKDVKLNPKLSTRNMGPFRILEVKSSRNRVKLEISATVSRWTHFDDIMEWNGEVYDDVLQPDVGEIIPNRSLPVYPERLDEYNGSHFCEESEKVKFNIKLIVGKRVYTYWPSTRLWYTGSIIGYNSDLKFNLIFYDTRTTGVPVSSDFYKIYLFKIGRKKPDQWKLLKDGY
jgi:hypothetical protein